jgi:hypothetical protein
MFRIPLASPDSSLLLAPRWGELHGFWQVVLLALVGGVPLALVIWLYRYELKLVRRRTAAALLALRLVVLLVPLFLVGFQPIVSHTTTEELPGRVLVAVDRSASMDVADPQRPAVDKLRLARALGVAGDLCTRAQLDGWIRQYEEKGGPQWGDEKERADDRASHDRVCRRIDEMTRAQVGARVLAADGLRLLDTVAARHKVELLGFAQEAWDVKTDSDAGAAANEKQPAAGALQFTDLRLPLTRALERSGPDQGRILGVVVLTDGQHNWGPTPVKKALELGEHQLPVYPVALGARQAPPDIALVSVRAPAAVFKDVDAQVEARFKVSGLPAQEIVVELSRPDGPPLTERVRHDGSDHYYSVRFQVRLSQVGAQALTVAARPVTGESRTDNNSRPVVINVADDKARVLLVDGEVRWEFHYLANALARDRTVQAQGVVFNQPRLGRVPEEDLQKTGTPRLTLPTEPDALAGYDCILLGDVTPAQLPAADRARLEKYVADGGGTLVLLAGKRTMPLSFLDGDADDPLRRLLPVEAARAVSPEKGFPVTLTHEGKLVPFLQMDAAPDKSEQRWGEFPRHFWGVVGRTKPGATPLAYLADDADARKPGEQEKEQALIVRQNYGFGRVLFVGLDSTWRWRYKVGDTYHHRFWGQVVRWAASDKPLVAGNEYVRFGTREPVYRQGQEVDLTVRLGEEVRPLGPNALAGARVLRVAGAAEEAVALVPLAPREGQPRVLEGKVRDLPAGAYTVELAIPELADKLQMSPGPDGQPGKLRAAFTVTPPDSEEMVELATNWPLLEELAAKSGGRVFTPENATELVDLLTRQSVTRQQHTENPLWQWWVTLVLLLGLLTLEWVGRKLAGLP